jgi:hypothetical protein
MAKHGVLLPQKQIICLSAVEIIVIKVGKIPTVVDREKSPAPY